MKKIFLSLFALFVSLNAAYAANPTVTTETVKYKCQAKKTVTVKYGFNKEGLPTYASARLEGKERKMPINLDVSDNVDTFFGTETSYSLSAEQMDKNNYRQKSILITSPSQEILFKGCVAN